MTISTETDLAEHIRAANGPLAIQGGGTRGVAIDGDALDISGLTGVTLYEPEALTLVAQAGTPVAEIDSLLDAQGQRLAFEPPDMQGLMGTKGVPTIGGVIATNSSGPRRFQVGAARDFALGLRFVDGAGTIIKNGGRVMKNVTGYDLVKLLCGSWGTLGVLSEVSLKVLPKPETETTLRLHGVSGLRGLDAMTRAVNSPYEVTGAAHQGDDVLLRVEGFEASVTYRVAELSKLLGGEISLLDADQSAAEWRAIRDVLALAGCPFVWRISMTPRAMYSGLLAAMTQNFECETQIDWAGGLCWIGLRDAQEAAKFHPAVQAAVADREINEGGGGHATLLKAPNGFVANAARFQPEMPAVAALSAGLRAKFDPRGILNRGLMG